MITITSAPPSVGDTSINLPKQPPVPVSDCFRWCLQADTADAISVAGAKANVTVTFPSVCTVPANGTEFTIWGVLFTVDDSEDYTANSFKVETLGFLSWLNFANMILANLQFNRAVSLAGQVVGSSFELQIIWNDCREQERFSGVDVDLAGVEATGATTSFANGSSPVYVEAFKILSRAVVYRDATNAFDTLGRLEALESDLLCDSVAEICVDYKLDIEQKLFTRLPDLTATSFIDEIENGRSIMKLFALEYGWSFRSNCQVQSGTIKRSQTVLGINAVIPLEDKYGMRRYWHEHPDGYPPGQTEPEFLTLQPKGNHKLCLNSFSWLWMTNNFQHQYGGNYRLVVKFQLYQIGSSSVFEEFEHTAMDSVSDSNLWYQCVCFNTSPAFVLANAPTLTAANLAGYDVQVFGLASFTSTVLFTASEKLSFSVINSCTECTDIYFLSGPGGIGTQIVTVNEREIVTAGTEILINSSCDLSNTDRARYGGRSLTALRSYERISFTLELPNTTEYERWAKDFRKSPQHWIKVFDYEGEPFARKMLLDGNTVKVYKNGEGIKVEATGYLADIVSQKGIEP